MRAVIKKWGNSAALRLPSSIMEAAHLNIEQEIDVREQDGMIVLKPVVSSEVTLADLVDGITPENMHDDTEFGRAEGKEVNL